MAASKACLLDLPDEILLLIFSYLSLDDLLFGVKPTCDRFHQLSLVPQLWRQITIACFDWQGGQTYLLSRSPEGFYERLAHQKYIKRTQHLCGEEEMVMVQVKDVVTSVEERGFVWHTWPKCSAARGLFYPKLRRLTMRELVRLPAMDFLTRYSGLDHLHLETCSLFYDIPWNTNLNTNLKKSSFVDLFKALKGMKNLRTLKLMCSDCIDHQEPGDDVVRESMMEYFRGGPELRHVHLKLTFVNVDIIRCIVDCCLNLEDLDVCSCTQEKEFIPSISQETRPSLTSLILRNPFVVCEQSLRAISLSFPNLKALELRLSYGMTDDDIKDLHGICSHLTRLIVQETEDSASRYSMMKKLALGENLQSLHLKDFDLTSAPQICLPLCNLHTLELNYCSFVRRDIEALAESCPLLQTATVWGAKDSQHILSVFLQRFPSLQTLFYHFHCSTTPQGLFSWLHQPGIQGMPSLQSLTLSFDRLSLSFDDQYMSTSDVLMFTNLLPSLRHLDLRMRIFFLSDDTFGQILRNCPRMQHLKLRSTFSRHPHEGGLNLPLTEACLGHILKWGTCLQSLMLVTWRSFSLVSLVDTMLQSSKLTACTVHDLYYNDRAPQKYIPLAAEIWKLSRKNFFFSVWKGLEHDHRNTIHIHLLSGCRKSMVDI